jgi:hypothetical protein
MENNNEAGNSKEAELENVDDEIKVNEEDQDSAEFWKAQALKNHGIAKRYQTKFQKAKEAEETRNEATKEVKREEKPAEKKPDGLDYGQKAYLVANDIKSDEEIKLVETIMSETGKSLESVLQSKYFKAEIEEMREKVKSKEASDATSNSKRSSNSAKNEVEYWIAKGELPEDITLRRAVVKARMAKDGNGNPFR